MRFGLPTFGWLESHGGFFGGLHALTAVSWGLLFPMDAYSDQAGHLIRLKWDTNPMQSPIVQHQDIRAGQLFQGFQVGAFLAGDLQGFQES